MAGFLAWAADVVGGSGNGDKTTIIPKFSKEDEQYVRELDRKVSSLQRYLQLLRQRLHPPNSSIGLSHSLPHLHADFAASNSALALEQQAHNSTREQTQNREATLQEENLSYERAIAAGNEEIIEKARETEKLKARLKEVDETVVKLQKELESLQALQQARAVEKLGDKTKSDGKDRSIALPYLDAGKENELEKKRNELKSWENKLSTLEEKWKTLQNTLGQRPSPAQREKELERRLRGLTEQLMLKQVQADNLSKEKRAIESRLNEFYSVNMNNFDAESSFRKRLERSSSARGVIYEGDSSKIPARAVKGLRDWGNVIFWSSDSISLGSQWKFRILRSLIAAYILGLHLVFIISAFIKLGR
eukprot:TRINITY_DN3857_c0_g1_i2.p1 TRINITY_DN3857_c0_g1~~TRINITY_DN3857_c0_g1_i2.p1  ORF type:complete len:362 (+),score=78.64 TRINITY_DN3857_c0_g1_i2:303-1388(+)